jgi:hypothetical protein
VGRAAQHVVLSAGVVLVIGLIVGAVVLTQLDSGHGSLVRQPNVKPATNALPPLPREAVVLAGESGTRAVALAVGTGIRPKLTATVLGQDGDPASGLPLSFRVGSAALPALACGPGCYRPSPRRCAGRGRPAQEPIASTSRFDPVRRPDRRPASRVTRRLRTRLRRVPAGPDGWAAHDLRPKAPMRYGTTSARGPGRT